MKKDADSTTRREYGAFQRAYNFFNRRLFGSELPHVLVTLQRKAGTRGYFSPGRFQSRASTGDTVHELALNPDTFTGRSDDEILSTLVHEMVHVWQETWGTPTRGGYHNREWSAKMKEVGLCPSSTGQPGGKEIGQTMTHYIIPKGVYAHCFRDLQRRGFKLNWQSSVANLQATAKRASKTKYVCPHCMQNAWAKPGALLACADCSAREGALVRLMSE